MESEKPISLDELLTAYETKRIEEYEQVKEFMEMDRMEADRSHNDILQAKIEEQIRQREREIMAGDQTTILKQQLIETRELNAKLEGEIAKLKQELLLAREAIEKLEAEPKKVIVYDGIF